MKDNIRKAIDELDKLHGKGTVVSFEAERDNSIKRWPTGSLGLNIATGGGWPTGRIVEIYGPESSGKSTLCLHAIAEVQREGGVAAYIDAEHAFDPMYAENLGIDLKQDNFLFSQPDNGEQAFDIAEKFVRTGEVDLIVIDSVAALVPKAEIDGDYGESKMGLHARLMSQSMRKLVGLVSKKECTIIFVNQLRDKIGVMFGNPETTTGGNALKFYASVRCDVRRISQEKDGDEVTGNRTRVKVIKNKTFPPFKQCEFSIVFGEGICFEGEVVDQGVEMGLIKKSGSWFSYGETKLGQGRDSVISILKDNPELLEELRNKIESQI